MATNSAHSFEPSRERSGDRDQKLNQIIADYLEAREAGALPDRSALLHEHPDLAEELAVFFANQDHLAQLTGRAPMLLPFPASRRDAMLTLEPRSGLLDTQDGAGAGAASLDAHVRYFGDYELIEVLAQGGMGVVYKARQVSLDRVLAVKMVRAGPFATPGDLQRFHREAEAAAHLDHPHIVPIYEVGEHDGHHYFSMKLVDGGNLAAYVERFRDAPRAAARLVATVARAVHYAHERGILHRDLKPANILLSGRLDQPLEERVPLVTDFGLAKRFESPQEPGLTQSGSIVGTPAYMAPEQAEGRRESITIAADTYALGAILFELLTGRPPFRAETMLETLRMVREQEPERPRSLNPKIDRDLETIVLKCLEKAPGRRYASPQALAEDLDRWLADVPLRGRRSRFLARAIMWARRRPAAAALLVMIAVSMGGLLAVARLKRDVAKSGFALLAEQEKRRKFEAELIESRARKLRMEEDQYFQQVVAAEQALAAKDPGRAAILLEECPPRLRNWEWRHLSKRLHSEVLVIQGHSGLVCPDFRPDTTSVECHIDVLGRSIWDAAGSPKLRRMHGPDGTAYGMAVDRAGTRIATAGADGQVKVWDMTAGRLLHVLRGHEGWAAGVAFSFDGTRLASSGQDGTVRIWDVSDRPGNTTDDRALQVVRGHEGGVFGVSFSPDGNKLASAGKDGTARVWDLTRRPAQAIFVFRGHDSEVCCLAFDSSGQRIASGGADRMVRVWDIADGRQILQFHAAASRVNAVAFSPDGTKLATGSLDRTVDVWDVATGQLLTVLPGHAAPVFQVAFGATGTRLISSSQDATVKLWDLASEPGVSAFRVEPREPEVRWVGGVLFRPDGNELLAGGTHHTLATWDLSTGRLKRAFGAGDGTVIALAYDRDGTRLAAAASDRSVQIWEPGSSRAPLNISDPRDGLASIALSPDGKVLATGGGRPPAVIQTPKEKVPPTEDEARMVRFWDANTGAAIGSLSGHTGSIHALAFSPDGRLVASAGADRIVRIWDRAEGRLRNALQGHANTVFAVAFSPDGTRLASAGADRGIYCWDVETGRLVRTLTGHTNWVMGVAYSPDGSRLASAGADQTVRVWDPARGQEVLTLRGPRDRVHGVAFSPDGTRLAGASADGVVRVWETEPRSDSP